MLEEMHISYLRVQVIVTHHPRDRSDSDSRKSSHDRRAKHCNDALHAEAGRHMVDLNPIRIRRFGCLVPAKVVKVDSIITMIIQVSDIVRCKAKH